MLQALAAVPAILASRSALGQEASSAPRWKSAIGLNGFESSSRKYQKNYPIWEILDFASTTGFDGIELVQGWPMGFTYPSSDDSRRIQAVRRLVDGFGLQIFSIQTDSTGAFSPDAEDRKEWLARFRDQAQFAKSVGCEWVGTWPGGGLRGQSIEEAIARLAASYREAGRIVEDLGLMLSFEIEPPFVFNTEVHIHQILEQTNHPRVKTMYDPSHYDLMNGSSGAPHEMLLRVGVEHIGYVHLTDTDGTLRDGGTSKHLPCGDGHAQIDTSLRILREKGFSGWLMIDAWEIPDAYDACAKGYAAIQKAI
jgi:sugar phosphate isomerase/epimerase